MYHSILSIRTVSDLERMHWCICNEYGHLRAFNDASWRQTSNRCPFPSDGNILYTLWISSAVHTFSKVYLIYFRNFDFIYWVREKLYYYAKHVFQFKFYQTKKNSILDAKRKTNEEEVEKQLLRQKRAVYVFISCMIPNLGCCPFRTCIHTYESHTQFITALPFCLRMSMPQGRKTGPWRFSAPSLAWASRTTNTSQHKIEYSYTFYIIYNKYNANPNTLAVCGYFVPAVSYTPSKIYFYHMNRCTQLHLNVF